MNNYTTIMSKCLDSISRNLEDEKSHLDDLLIKRTRITKNLQQAISTALSKSFSESTTVEEMVSIIKAALNLDLTPFLNKIQSENEEEEAKAFARINQYQITYLDFNPGDVEDVIDALQDQKQTALKRLATLLNQDPILAPYLEGREIKHLSVSKTQYRDVFHIAATYSDQFFGKCIGKFGAITRFMNSISSETYYRMMNANIMLNEIDPDAKAYVLKNKGKLTPSSFTETVDDLRKEIFQCELTESVQKTKLSKYKYEHRMYEVAKSHKPISVEEVKSSILMNLERESLKGDIRKLLLYLEDVSKTNESIKYIARDISELYASRCLLMNLIAYYSRSTSLLDEVFEKKRLLLNKASKIVTEKDFKTYGSTMFNPEQFNAIYHANAEMRGKSELISYDFSKYSIESPFDIEEHLNKLNAEPSVLQLFPVRFGFSVEKSPDRNFESSGLFNEFFKTHYELIYEIEKENSLINKMVSNLENFNKLQLETESDSGLNLDEGISVGFDASGFKHN
ncbi:hypothetical protein DMW08_26025 [Vibrio parahaemolyticus]|nr:hypothetical protein [Vibrio parahaemolyticus]EGR2987844.1 hypothetical protein [Vibrio parahaemolyticus]